MKRPSPRPKTMSKSVLIVDDDKEILNLFRLVLEEEGYTVETASSGTEALEKSESGTYDLAILDIMMEDIKGHDLAPMLRKGDKPHILFITGYADGIEYVRALPFGPCPVILKPVMFSELVKVVGETLNE